MTRDSVAIMRNLPYFMFWLVIRCPLAWASVRVVVLITFKLTSWAPSATGFVADTVVVALDIPAC